MRHLLVRLVVGGLMLAATAVAGEPTTLQQVAAAAARKVVKIYGAGGVQGLEGYQSGIIISSDGRIATALSTVLDSDGLDCVLDDGRRFEARLVGVDPRRELAVLAIEAVDLPAFTPREERVTAGTRVLAISNLFGVAVGDERASVQRGVVAAVVPLEARRGAADAPYTGDVYVLDCTTNNPGSPGGAVVDSQGRLLGILGKELRATASGIWLNYALPADELARGCTEILAGTAGAPPTTSATPLDLRSLGLVLVPDLLARTPPFVESVVPGSAAAQAGLRPDDLVIAVGSRAVASCDAVQRAVGGVPEGDAVRLSLIRGGVIVECDLGPRPAEVKRP
ncbi:MAG: S1C family serine protease [Pirellulales bacterium]